MNVQPHDPEQNHGEPNDHEHHVNSGSVNAMALSATLHCLTGCAFGEIVGLMIGTALGFSNVATIALAVALAFLFGYSLSTLPPVAHRERRAGLRQGARCAASLGVSAPEWLRNRREDRDHLSVCT